MQTLTNSIEVARKIAQKLLAIFELPFPKIDINCNIDQTEQIFDFSKDENDQSSTNIIKQFRIKVQNSMQDNIIQNNHLTNHNFNTDIHMDIEDVYYGMYNPISERIIISRLTIDGKTRAILQALKIIQAKRSLCEVILHQIGCYIDHKLHYPSLSQKFMNLCPEWESKSYLALFQSQDMRRMYEERHYKYYMAQSLKLFMLNMDVSNIFIPKMHRFIQYLIEIQVGKAVSKSIEEFIEQH